MRRGRVRTVDRSEAIHQPLSVVARMPAGKHTTARCKATHDVPYTLRCVKDSRHVSPDNHPITQRHEDKEGRVWDGAELETAPGNA